MAQHDLVFDDVCAAAAHLARASSRLSMEMRPLKGTGLVLPAELRYSMQASRKCLEHMLPARMMDQPDILNGIELHLAESLTSDKDELRYWREQCENLARTIRHLEERR